MFILRNFLFAVSYVLNFVISIYIWIIIADIIFSWIGADSYNTLVKTIRQSSYFLVGRIRRKLNLTIGMFDLTPMIAILLLQFSKMFIVTTLMDIAKRI